MKKNNRRERGFSSESDGIGHSIFRQRKYRFFFAMVEGSQIDWAGHNNNAKYLISEMIDFDETVGKALDFAEKDGETLVIVTSDHETGGFTLASKKNKRK